MRQSVTASLLSFCALGGIQAGARSVDRISRSVIASSPGTTDYSAPNVLNGDTSTVWATDESSTSNRSTSTYNITIDLREAQPVSGISFLPSQNIINGPGKLADVHVYLGDDGSTWGQPVATGTFLRSTDLKTKYFNATTARYVKMAVMGQTSGRRPNISAAEVNALSGAPKLRFNVTADSYEATQANCSPENAVDYDTSTIWHTQYSAPAGAAPFPHWARLDLGNPAFINSLTYTPRQDCCSHGNGNIGQYELGVSVDDVTYTTVAFGTFRDDNLVKTVKFTETFGRFVKLTALSEAGNRGPWTSAAELDVGVNADFVLPPMGQSAVEGKWGPTISFPVIPVAAAMLANGGVLTWSSWAPDTYQNAPADGDTLTVTSTLFLDQSMVKQQAVANTHHDMFCPGLSLDARGRPVVTGGNSGRENSLYDVTNDTWIAGTPMSLQRGYQAQTTISDGKIFILGGSWRDGPRSQGGKNAELYDPVKNTITTLSECPVAPILTADSAGVYRQDNHAWLFGWNNGSVFQAGPSAAMNWYGTSQNGSQTAAGTRAGSGDSMNGNAVMFDVGRILTAGGSPDYQDKAATADAHIITIGDPNSMPNVTDITSMAYARSFASGVALPDGKVLIAGGQSWATPFSDDTAILIPELFDPTNNTFSPMAPHATPRTYHSFALLMPDASVIHGGGGLCGSCSTNHFDAEIFYPPYLFQANGSRATQPKILSTSSTTLKAGDTVKVRTDVPITKFSFVRMGSATHTVNTDQRRIPLDFSPVDASNTYKIRLPSDSGVLIPGYWMLFGMTAAGVPSKAATILVSLQGPKDQ